jgi:hypothetical protein
MAAQSQQVLGLGVIRAATKAVNLCFAGIMATSSVVLQSWSLFGVSLAGYATLVAWDLTRLGFWKRVLKEMRSRPPPLPEPDEVTDASARHFVNRLHQARLEMQRVLEGMQGGLPARVVANLETLPEVEKRALDLIARLEETSRYLADKNVRGLRNEVERLRRVSETAPSMRLRLEYKKAHFALAQELQALEDIAASKDLIMAKLETVAGALEMFPCEIVRLRVMEAEARDPSDELPFDPRAIVADGDTFERLLGVGSGQRDGKGETEESVAPFVALGGGKVSGGG